MAGFSCISPIDGKTVFSADFATTADIEHALVRAKQAQSFWETLSVSDRAPFLQTAIDYLYDNRDNIGLEITEQMGRPIRYSPGELIGTKERGEKMLALANQALADISPAEKSGFKRFITREPLGTVAVLAPWNYPFLTSVNAIIPALAAGNAVILKHSAQTPLVALRYVKAFEAAGLPEGLFQNLFLDHAGAATLIGDPRIDYVAFTGSVGGGHAIVKAISHKFINAGLELGGKDAAYVREDADIAMAATALADGAFFNSGQSCCGIERIYVHKKLFEDFTRRVVDEAKALKLGDPKDPGTTMGPMTSAAGADAVRKQIDAAIAQGATAQLPINQNYGNNYLKPQVLTNVSHDMAVMTEESFGPVVGIMPVENDAEAIDLINDSDFGLTASIWTKDPDKASEIGRQIEAGTIFMNRCDYLDPELAWTGVKNSGRGASLSVLGFEQLTRPKSFHLKLTD